MKKILTGCLKMGQSLVEGTMDWVRSHLELSMLELLGVLIFALLCWGGPKPWFGIFG